VSRNDEPDHVALPAWSAQLLPKRDYGDPSGGLATGRSSERRNRGSQPSEYSDTSAADIDMTRQVVEAGREGVASFKALGLM
jgi:hypothetical protein